MKPVKPIELFELFANLRKKLNDFYGSTEPGSDAEWCQSHVAIAEQHFQRTVNKKSMAKANEPAAVKVDPVDDVVVL